MKKEILITCTAIAATLTILAVLIFQLTGLLYGNDASLLTVLLYLTCLLFLVKGNFIYFATRIGYLLRKGISSPADDELTQFFKVKAPSLTILVPSYKEETEVVKLTLLSSCLQEYPNKEVVLLIDDPPHPEHDEDLTRLNNTRNLPKEIQELFAPLQQKFKLELEQYKTRKSEKQIDVESEWERLASLHEQAENWFTDQERDFHSDDHVTKTFIEHTFKIRAEKHMRKRDIIKREAFSNIEQEYHYLATVFDVKISTFERKKFENLSHAPNKAMNLNSYIGLMGKTFTLKDSMLIEDPNGTLSFPDSDYIAMLDADTILTHNYAARLIYAMESPAHKKTAVIQTPYSTFPNATGLLERVAGATTDIQYISHQGFTYFNATFWVGANAVIRKIALNDIVETHSERGHTVYKFIQDRTVIEDTESSIDLVHKGWQLHNYPQRLSYSATPPDFGSLMIQRRRWANGGLLILPKLFLYILQKPLSLKRWIEGIIRFHYLFSQTAMMFVLPIMTLLSLSSTEYPSGALFLSLPYFWLYARDLSQNGYRYGDIFRVIALNTLLIPVNCAGVIKSIKQAFTGRHSPFCRTPKIAGRTSIPVIYLSNVFSIALIMFFLLTVKLYRLDPINTFAFHCFFSLSLIYGTVTYLGIKNCIQDIFFAGKLKLATN